MIIVRLKGGMGNQLFQYAFGRKLATMQQTDLQLDLSSLLDRAKGDFVYRDYDLPAFRVEHRFLTSPKLLRFLYKSKSSLVSKLIRKQVQQGRGHVREAHFHYQPELLDAPRHNAIYEGWFQSYRYFEGIEEVLRKEFAFTHEVLPESRELLQQIEGSESVCLNVRRTDFLKVDNLNTTDLDYFLRSAARMCDELQSPRFFIFSDDVQWCRDNIKLKVPMQLVDHSHKGFKFTNYMQLMSACRHFIIPNSSYAWWAIWLNTHADKKVIAPRRWFNDPEIDTTDLVPDHWIRM